MRNEESNDICVYVSGECEKFMLRPKRVDGSLQLVHGLLRCKTLIVLVYGIVTVTEHPIFIFVVLTLLMVLEDQNSYGEKITTA